MKRFNIDMQETQHLDHLSPALHLLLPTMKTYQTKHHAYKFQVAITIVCHKAVDPSVVTQPPVTLTSEMVAVYADAAPPLDDVSRQLLNFIGVFEVNGSGWVFSHFQDLQLPGSCLYVNCKRKQSSCFRSTLPLPNNYKSLPMLNCAPTTLLPNATYATSFWEGTKCVIIVTLWETIAVLHIVGVTWRTEYQSLSGSCL